MKTLTTRTIDLLPLRVLVISSLLRLEYTAAAAASQAAGYAGSPECPCIDSTKLLEEQFESCYLQQVVESDHNITIPGVVAGKNCVPLSFGAEKCSAHDSDSPFVSGVCGSLNPPPSFCYDRWCYVDPQKCRQSREHFFSSDYFDNLYYSYTTCDNSEGNYKEFKSLNGFENKTLVVALVGHEPPYHYKVDEEGNMYESDSPAYFDDDIPWQGANVDFFNDVIEISNIPSVLYVHRSKGSQTKGIANSYTQTVTDVQAGVADLSVSSFWVTAERLTISPFTVPVMDDAFRLWIPQPKGVNEQATTLADNIKQCLLPFSPALWATLVITVFFFAIISIFVSPRRFEKFHNDKKKGLFHKARLYSRTVLDSTNVSALHFLNGGVDYEIEDTVAQKSLNFGFALLIFLAITTYTANLAAFLTISAQSDHLSSIEMAIAHNIPICAASAVADDLKASYPTANWVFELEIGDVFKGYDQGSCKGVVMGIYDIKASHTFQDMICDRELVQVGGPLLEKPISFPARADLAAGLSYWLARAREQGIDFGSYITERVGEKCSLVIELPSRSRRLGVTAARSNSATDNTETESDLKQITVSHMMMPLVVFLISCILAIIIHIFFFKIQLSGTKVGPGFN